MSEQVFTSAWCFRRPSAMTSDKATPISAKARPEQKSSVYCHHRPFFVMVL